MYMCIYICIYVCVKFNLNTTSVQLKKVKVFVIKAIQVIQTIQWIDLSSCKIFIIKLTEILKLMNNQSTIPARLDDKIDDMLTRY